jgi:hypothetical protein
MPSESFKLSAEEINVLQRFIPEYREARFKKTCVGLFQRIEQRLKALDGYDSSPEIVLRRRKVWVTLL